METQSKLIGSENLSVQTTFKSTGKTLDLTASDPLLFRLLLSLTLMGLFAEWLHPFTAIVEGSSGNRLIEVLYVLTAVLLFIGMFGFRWFVSTWIYVASILFAWMYAFEEGVSLSWMRSYIDILQNDAVDLLNTGHYTALSQETRTLVLVIGWCMLVYSVQSLALFRRSIMLFAVATVLFLIGLETVLDLQVYADVIRTCMLVLLLQGLTHLARLRDSDASGVIRKSVYGIWIISVSLAAVGLVAIVWSGLQVMPAKELNRASLNDAVGHVQAWAETGYMQLGQEKAETGYNLSGDMIDMGQPIIQNSKPYFIADSPVQTYWRGEILNNYDGRKWSMKPDNLMPTTAINPFGSKNEVIAQEKGNLITQHVEFKQALRQDFPLFGGGIISKVVAVETGSPKALPVMMADPLAGTIKLAVDTNTAGVVGYKIETYIPKVELDKLRLQGGTDPSTIKDHYLQLPGELPARVKELGLQVTSGNTNRYDTVYAVKEYLAKHMTYTLDTRVPAQGQDFVDNFLFETKQGYCTHFATAMTVLLRSQNIPARYVMGFAPGQKYAGEANRYLITEGDAHAWVEVYFPQQGWVPFDPTPGAATGSIVSPVLAPQTSDNNIYNVFSYTWSSFINPSSWSKMLGLITVLNRLNWVLIVGTSLSLILLFLAVHHLWHSREMYRLWKQLHFTRRTFPHKKHLMAAANPVWEGLGRRYGAIDPGATVREYITSLNIEEEIMRSRLYSFADDWEKIAYDEVPPNRTTSIAFMQECWLIANQLV
ncbi:transglutaminase TgpA family protein [Paenibacillus pini]|uniref:Transglutaminase-like enzymes n=1 Tax=Paenibacillus pini JCM 16418 TaxID=1236976 RepID=W7Z5R0_9BACL|nr:transglutaminase domain-containing protein [Paenibacillus pini]GAF09654.1 transglutaminase-like enzymes [Paenibacillus pini JCM 16418]